ncbi:transposase family protein [Myxococcota bacterium]
MCQLLAASSQPSTGDVTNVLDINLGVTGTAPKYIVSDQGPQFGDNYELWCQATGIKPRLGQRSLDQDSDAQQRCARSGPCQRRFRRVQPFRKSGNNPYICDPSRRERSKGQSSWSGVAERKQSVSEQPFAWLHCRNARRARSHAGVLMLAFSCWRSHAGVLMLAFSCWRSHAGVLMLAFLIAG